MSSRVQITDRLALDPNLSYGGVTQGTEIAVPIDFSGGTGTGAYITSQTISGGALGQNGWAELEIYGTHSLTADSVVGLSAAGVAGAAGPVQTQTLLGGETYYFNGRVVIQNMNSEDANMVHFFLDFGRSAAASKGPYRFGATTIVPTSADWTFAVAIETSSASSGTAEIYTARVTAYFIP